MDKANIREVPKVWGKEIWIVNNEKYCGKKLILNRGFRCSIHHHKLKEETFYVESGKVLMEFGKDAKERMILSKGDAVHLAPNTWHRFTGLEDAEIFEFSTQHLEEDSYRTEKSGKVDLKTLDMREQ
ncbi:TPA: cupin domain-containing protein [Candidatus Woesearchaeota archaeon]|nr:cupin domain-containing protein [Candidatus Woesearchaeota archaeon]HII68523.1 cupin domain-containing protein [Candidatus Woesearchaeota archaeon]